MGRKRLTLADFAMHKHSAEAIRKHMIAAVKAVPQNNVAVLLSSGVDSHACLFAALEAGKKVTCYTFRLDGVESIDWKIAQKTALLLGLDWKEVVLPADLESLYVYLKEVFYTYNTHRIRINKTTAECMWPMFATLKEVLKDGNKATVLGMGGDVFFATTRRQLKMVKAGQYNQILDSLKAVTASGSNAQDIMTRSWLALNGAARHRLVYPFYDAKLIEVMRKIDPLTQGNVPIQKAPVRAAFFEYFAEVDVRTHISYQKGDSGISARFEELVKTPLNIGKWRSVVGIYNALENAAVDAWEQHIEFEDALCNLRDELQTVTNSNVLSISAHTRVGETV